MSQASSAVGPTGRAVRPLDPKELDVEDPKESHKEQRNDRRDRSRSPKVRIVTEPNGKTTTTIY